MTQTAKERIEEEHNFPKYDLDADFWRNRWVESSAEALQQQLKLIKLEKQIATAVEALEIIEQDMFEASKLAREALSEIGGDR